MKTDYRVNTDIRFNPLELIDVERLQRETKDQWMNQTLCRRKIAHRPRRPYRRAETAARLHRAERRHAPHGAPVRSVILMIEGKGVGPTGD